MQLFENLESDGEKKKNIEKIAFKVVQIKFLAMHITNEKYIFGTFTVGNLENIFMDHDCGEGGVVQRSLQREKDSGDSGK